MKRISIAVLAVMALWAMSACNTVQGMGKDLEKGGQAIERAANR